jgi:hypothetical protein
VARALAKRHKTAVSPKSAASFEIHATRCGKSSTYADLSGSSGCLALWTWDLGTLDSFPKRHTTTCSVPANANQKLWTLGLGLWTFFRAEEKNLSVPRRTQAYLCVPKRTGTPHSASTSGISTDLLKIQWVARATRLQRLATRRTHPNPAEPRARCNDLTS